MFIFVIYTSLIRDIGMYSQLSFYILCAPFVYLTISELVPYHYISLHLFQTGQSTLYFRFYYTTYNMSSSNSYKYLMYCFIQTYLTCILPDDDTTGIKTWRSF